MNLLMIMLHKRKMLTVSSLCLSGMTVAATLWWNAQLSGIINTVSAGTAPSTRMILLALVTMLALCAANYGKSYISGFTCESMAHDLRMGYARFFSTLPVMESEKLNAGEQLSLLQNEIIGVSDYMTANLFQLIDDFIRFLATFAWLSLLHPPLALAANLPVFAIVAYVFWSSKIIGTATALSQEAKGRMNQFADALLTLFPIIRLYDAVNMTISGYANAVKDWENQTILAERKRARLMSLSALLGKIPLLLLFLVGGRMAIGGTLSLGTLYIFLNLSENVSGPLMNMPAHIGAFRQFSANMKRLEGKVCL